MELFDTSASHPNHIQLCLSVGILAIKYAIVRSNLGPLSFTDLLWCLTLRLIPTLWLAINLKHALSVFNRSEF